MRLDVIDDILAPIALCAGIFVFMMMGIFLAVTIAKQLGWL